MKRFFYHNFRIYYRIRHYISRKFTKGGFLVLTGTGLSAVLGINTYRAMAYQIFTFLLLLLITAFVCSCFFRLRIRAERVLPRFATSGEKLFYSLVIHKQSSGQLKGLRFIEEFADPRPDFRTFANNPEPGEKFRNSIDRFMGFYRWKWLLQRRKKVNEEYHPLPPLLPGTEIRISADILPQERGILHFRGLTVGRPDPFGLMNACRFLSLSQSLTVLPRRYELPPFRLPGTRRHQSGGIALSSSVGDSEEFISLRDYRPGDPLRKIHWKSWARTGKPVVKEFQGEFFVRHALVLDTFQEEEYSEVFEEAVAVAASFACTVRTRESLLDLMFVGTQTYCITSGRGLGHLEKSLEVLASVRPCRDKTFFTLSAAVLERAAFLSGCICVLLKWEKEQQDFVARLKARGLPLLLLLIVPPGREKIAPGPMKDSAEYFHILECGKVAEGLSALRTSVPLT
ncbi:MAG: DUF58 domain-containing protein [Desulfococcaceae bacterium]|jgi:uncharacterized protein (DUF58 family)|nr:DUF58 domain-containing protein [Desulfococcaceae bacterium]